MGLAQGTSWGRKLRPREQRILRWLQQVEPRIVQVFRDNRIRGRLGRVFVTPQLVVWRLHLTNFNLTDVNRVNQLDSALETALSTPGVRIRNQRGHILLEVPLPEAYRVYFPARYLPKGEGLKIAIGLEYDGRPYWIDFALVPHLLLVGATQVGSKSETLKTIAWLLARQNNLSGLVLYLVDLKGGVALKQIEPFAHVPYPVATSAKEAAALIHHLDQVMQERFKSKQTTPPIFLLVDEVFVLTQKWGSAADYLARLASQGRGAGIHLVLATQRATKETLGNTSMIGANIPARLVGKVESATSSTLAVTMPQAGAEELLGNGDVVGNLTGQVIRFQVGLWDANPEPVPVNVNKRPIPVEDLSVEKSQRGGHNKIEIQPEWVTWAVEHGKNGQPASQYKIRQELGLSSSVAKRVYEAAKCEMQIRR